MYNCHTSAFTFKLKFTLIQTQYLNATHNPGIATYNDGSKTIKTYEHGPISAEPGTTAAALKDHECGTAIP